jgi:hypothetical protein
MVKLNVYRSLEVVCNVHKSTKWNSSLNVLKLTREEIWKVYHSISSRMSLYLEMVLWLRNGGPWMQMVRWPCWLPLHLNIARSSQLWLQRLLRYSIVIPSTKKKILLYCDPQPQIRCSYERRCNLGSSEFQMICLCRHSLLVHNANVFRHAHENRSISSLTQNPDNWCNVGNEQNMTNYLVLTSTPYKI